MSGYLFGEGGPFAKGINRLWACSNVMWEVEERRLQREQGGAEQKGKAGASRVITRRFARNVVEQGVSQMRVAKSTRAGTAQ